MKLQCPCGAKYDFEITPDMVRQPVKLVCASCGLDSSDFVNEMIRQEFAGQAAAGAVELPEPSLTAAPRLRMAHSTAPANEPPAASLASTGPDVGGICLKHPRQKTVECCRVCEKPICPQCMELFGYVCSPACQARATSHGIAVPEFAGQRNVVEAKRWRKIGAVAGGVGLLLVLLLGGWIWYAWFGSVPKPVFAVRFPESAHSGMVRLSGDRQVVFLRGGTLARYDLATQKEVWSRDLLDRAKIERAVDRQMKEMQAIVDKANAENPDYAPKMPSRDKLLTLMTRAAEASLELRLTGNNVRLIAPEKITRLAWADGKTALELARVPSYGNLGGTGDELVFQQMVDGQLANARLNLASGDVATEKLPGTALPETVVASAGKTGGAGLPLGRNPGGGTLDPEKVAEQAQNLSAPARIALPALLATAANQERTMAELNGGAKPKPAEAAKAKSGERPRLFSGPHGVVEMKVRLLEEKITTHSAMKPPPKKSALNGDLNVTQTAEVANEMLNDMQRARGGDVVRVDESRYQVTLRLPESAGSKEWSGEVTGPPTVFVLPNVNLLAAGTSLAVFDKSNEKLWQANLSQPLADHFGGDDEAGPYGVGPCVERGDTLYVFDPAVLTAFDKTTGKARWRLPSVGVVGLFFDDRGAVYVNTTTASPDKLRYSRQIDITDRTSAVIYKVDTRTGNVKWNTAEHGFITHLSGKFIYTVQSYDPGDDEEGGGNDLTEILRKPPFLRIRRINPDNGRKLWEHFQERAPLDLHFDDNTIELVFRKEVQVLKYLAW